MSDPYAALGRVESRDPYAALGRPVSAPTAPPPQQPSRPSALGAAGRAAERSVAPTLGGLAGFGAGAATAGTLGVPLEAIPVAGQLLHGGVTLAGGLAGAFGAGWLVNKAQDKVLSMLPVSAQRALGQDAATRQADEAQHPIASFAGELAPSILAMRPSLKAIEVAKDAPRLARILAHPVGSRIAGGIFGGGSELAREVSDNKGLDPTKLLIATGVGAAENRPTRLGDHLINVGGNTAIAAMRGGARFAGRVAGNAGTARQPFDAQATARDVTEPPEALPAPASQPEPSTPQRGAVVPVKGDPFASLGKVVSGPPPAAPAATPAPLPPVAVPNAELRPEPGPLGEGERLVRTPAGGQVRTKFEVVPSASLVQASGANQNRDRSRDTTTLQVQDIISKFDPELLHEDPSTDRGAPIVGPDNSVDSGNGRLLTLNQIYDQHPELADKYRAMIESKGFSTEGIDRPVLIQRRMTDMTPEQRRQFVIDSNKDTKLELSPVERAKSDADNIGADMLAKYAGGDLNSTANKGFVEHFTRNLTAGEMGNVIGTDRRLTTAGAQRIENAVVARAYDSPKLLERMLESTHDDIRAITSSLADVAPKWAAMRHDARAGEIDPQYDITADLADAAARVSDARKRGTKPLDVLAQSDAFDPMSPITAELIRAFHNGEMTRAASRKAVTELLHDYVDAARAQTASEGLFGAEPPKPPLSILKELLAKRDNPNGASMFDAPMKQERAHDDLLDAPTGTGPELAPSRRRSVDDAAGTSDDGSGRGAELDRADVASTGSNPGRGAAPGGHADASDGPLVSRRAAERDDAHPALPGGEPQSVASGGADRLAAASKALDELESADEEGEPHYSAAAPATPSTSGYRDSFEDASFTARASVYNTAAETLGIEPDKFTLLPPERQVELLQRAMSKKFGVTVTVKSGLQRRVAIDQMLDAFQNVQGMAHVLGLPARAISLEGSLTIQLQKSGRFLGAYQPATATIMLPQRSNSFAHEWGHALDYHLLGMVEGDGKGLSGAVRQGDADGGELSGDVRGAFVDLLNAMFFDKAGQAERVMQLEKKLAAAKTDKSKAALQAQLDRIKDGSSKARGIDSAFYANAKGFDGPGADYWQSPTEMMARSFEAYVSYKVEAAGLTTEFIGKGDANYLDGAGERFEKTFPKDDERTAIFAAYEILFGRIADATPLGGVAADRPEGSTTKLSDYDRQPAMTERAKRERGVIKGEMAAIKRAVDQARKEKAGRADNPKGRLEKAGDLNGAVFMSMTGNLRMIQARSKSPTLQKMIDLLAKQDGRGDRTVGRTFHEDVHLHSFQAINRVTNILKANDLLHRSEADDVLLSDLLTGAVNPDGTPGPFAPEGFAGHGAVPENFVRAAAGIRRILDGEFYENQKAGIDLGYTQSGYLQRTLDLPRAMHDSEGFRTQAGEVYKVVFDNAFHSPEAVAISDELLPRFVKLARVLSKRGYELPSFPDVVKALKALNAAAKKLDAAKLSGADGVDDLEARVGELHKELVERLGELWDELRPAFAKERAESWFAKINMGAGDEFNASAPDSKYTKHRSLPPEADKLLQKFYVADPIERVHTYLKQSARRTAYAKRFGHDGAKRKKMFEAMAREGVSTADQRTVSRILDTATGRRRSELPAAVQDAAATINAVGVMALLPRATLSSLGEPFTAGLVTGDARDGFRMVAMQIGQALKSPSGKVRYELARAMGIVTDAASDGILEARYGQTYADGTGFAKYTATMFRRTGLTWLTRSQKTAGVGLCHAFMDNLAVQMGKGGNAAKNAIALLRELGVRDPEAFATQLRDLRRMPTVEELDTPFGEDYRTAQIRFSDMVVQNPNPMDRPELSANPVGRVVYGITGFSYGYWRNVIKRNGILLFEKAKRSPADAMFYSGALFAAAALAYLINTTISTLRERALNPKRWHDLEKKGQLESTMLELGFTRTFSFGAADVGIQTVSGLKYQRDLSNAFIGPGPGFLAQNAQNIAGLVLNNSRKTNTAEYRATQGAYSAASPFLAFGLARIPGGPIVDVATGIGMGYVTSATARDDVATLVNGPKNQSIGPDGKKIKSGPTAYDKWLDGTFGEVKRKPRSQ